MRFTPTISVALAVLASGAHVQARTTGLLLSTRQTTPNVPQQCQSTCNAVVNVLANSCNVAQCCTNSFLQGLFDCYTCLAGVAGTTDFTADQASVDGVYDACAIAGVALNKVTFPGQDPNRVLSTVAGSASSTQSQSTQSTNTRSTSSISQSTVTSLTAPIQTISQSTVTKLPTTTPLPSATAAPASTTTTSAKSSARNLEGGVDLKMAFMMFGSLVAGFLMII